MTTDDETEAANQMEVATEAIREAVLRLLRLLREGEVDPQYVVLAAAGVTGELGRTSPASATWTSRRSWATSRTWCGRPAGRTPRTCRSPGAPETDAIRPFQSRSAAHRERPAR